MLILVFDNLIITHYMSNIHICVLVYILYSVIFNFTSAGVNILLVSKRVFKLPAR